MPLSTRLCLTSILGLVLCLSGTAIAEDDTNASGDQREKMKVYLGAEGGSAILPFATGGAVIGAYVGPNWLLNANYTEGSAKVDGTHLDWNYTEVRAKRFFGNSFFVNAGVGQRRFEFDRHADRIGGGDDVHLSAESMNTGLSVSVGNQWQWKNLSMGCDWVGAYIPLARKSTPPKKHAAATDKDQKDFEDLYDAIAEKPHFAALRVQVGVSF